MMPGEPTLLRELIIQRHWQKFLTFEQQFCRAAGELAEREGEPALRKVTVSERQFERWYAGKIKTAPYPDSCRVLEFLFGYSVDQLLAPASHVTHQLPSRTVPPERIRLPVRPNNAQQPGLNPAYTRSAHQGQQPRWSAEGSSLSDAERVLAMAARRALHFGASADASNIGPDSLEQLRAEAGRLALAYPQKPLAAIIGDIASLQDHTFTLLEGRQRPRETRDLYVIGGLTSGMLAKASHDLREPHMAMTHARTALLCAKNAEHAALIAWVRGLQSLITYWADRPREALNYALAGSEMPGIQGTVGIWLASLEARAWSALGNGASSRKAIARAADLRERTITDDLDAFGGICRFSRPRELYYAADAAARLADPDLAEDGLHTRTEDYATQAVAAYTSAPDDERSFADEAGSRTDLAIARARTGNLDGVREAIEPVLSLPAPQRINGIIESVISVHRVVTAKAADALPARDLQEEIESYCRTPAAALPR